ncbi:hypothetical protein KY360_00560 [Candidatus Woesearchaeota archaeon]|nr:hypothetical protein [Candidatus Woesearchaeota archaeon]
MKKNKKGMIVIQFNWIYVLVVGGLILALFVSVITKQRASSEMIAAGELQRRLETMLAGAISSPGASKATNIGRAKINFDCSGFTVGDQTRPFTPGISFAPSQITVRGKDFITWAQGWSLPYTVTNFLYVTSKRIRYVIVGDSDFANDIISNLPEVLNFETVASLTEAETLKYKNEDRTRFVVIDLTGDLFLDSSFTNADVSALQVSSAASSVGFYEKKPNTLEIEPKGTTLVVGIPDLYGAIFVDNLDTYECVMKAAYRRLNLISQVFVNRTKTLKDSYPSGDDCYARYDWGSFDAMIAATDLDPVEVGTIAANRDNIVTQNKYLQIYSCPLIY